MPKNVIAVVTISLTEKVVVPVFTRREQIIISLYVLALTGLNAWLFYR